MINSNYMTYLADKTIQNKVLDILELHNYTEIFSDPNLFLMINVINIVI